MKEFESGLDEELAGLQFLTATACSDSAPSGEGEK